jgi:curli biogenesis system outer membrane secretion channel CsgG
MISNGRLPAFAILLALACGNILVPAGAQSPRKLRVAVLDFDYSAVQSETSALFGSSIDVGRGIGDLLTADLGKDGTFSLIGQEALERSMDEEDFSDTDRSDQASAIKLGKLLRADAIIIGSDTKFDSGSQSNDSDGGHPDSKNRVRVEARIIDVETGQTQAVAEGAGESDGSSTILMGGWHGWARENVNFASSDFQRTVIGKAVKAAVDQLSGNLILNAAKAPRSVAKQEGVVAAVDGSLVVLNIGSGAGIMPGDLLEAFRFTKEVKDPSTGEVIRYLTTTVGVIKATDVDSRSSICTIVSGSGFQEGDHVRAQEADHARAAQ